MRRSLQLMNDENSRRGFAMIHPSAAELIEHARGELPKHQAATIATHLNTCLICRARMQRLAKSAARTGCPPTPPLERTPDLGIPEVLRQAASSGADDAAPEPGQLWRAAHHEGLLVWVRRVFDDAVAVMPAVFDADLADDLTLIVPADATPIGLELAIMTELETQIDRRALQHYISELPIDTHIDVLRRARRDGMQSAGILVGVPIESPLDQRLEYRQAIADVLADFTFDAYEPEPPTTDEFDNAIDARDLHAHLDALTERRAGLRISGQIPFLVPVDETHRLWVSASVEDLGSRVAVAVLTGPDAPSIQTEPAVAIACNHVREQLIEVEAVAVAITDAEWTTVVVSGADAQPAVEPPEGVYAQPQVRFHPLPLPDALMKYFEQSGSIWIDLGETTFNVEPANVPAVITESVQAAINNVIAQGRRSLTRPKKDAYTALSDRDRQHVEAAINALVRGESPDEVISILLDTPPA
jgi:hypothetical protein